MTNANGVERIFRKPHQIIPVKGFGPACSPVKSPCFPSTQQHKEIKEKEQFCQAKQHVSDLATAKKKKSVDRPFKTVLF